MEQGIDYDPATRKCERFWVIYLSDYMPHRITEGAIVQTVRQVSHGDWKTALAKNLPTIPKGTKLKVRGVWQNYYGIWVQVIYKERPYDISPTDLKLVSCEKNIDK